MENAAIKAPGDRFRKRRENFSTLKCASLNINKTLSDSESAAVEEASASPVSLDSGIPYCGFPISTDRGRQDREFRWEDFSIQRGRR